MRVSRISATRYRGWRRRSRRQSCGRRSARRRPVLVLIHFGVGDGTAVAGAAPRLVGGVCDVIPDATIALALATKPPRRREAGERAVDHPAINTGGPRKLARGGRAAFAQPLEDRGDVAPARRPARRSAVGGPAVPRLLGDAVRAQLVERLLEDRALALERLHGPELRVDLSQASPDRSHDIRSRTARSDPLVSMRTSRRS